MTGRTISHYQILEQLGEGGMGVVYKARDTHLDRFVAIKVLPPERVADPERKRRFVQEAKAASALNHPNIITIYDIDAAAGLDFIAMEYVAGKTLGALIPRKGMRLGEALKVGVQVADALARAHAAGIIHRDLKPSNVMVDEHGLVKVLDFGLAKLAEGPVGQAVSPAAQDEPTRTVKPQTAEGVIVGTVAYMSPEQAEGKAVDARSDIFSFGSLLYEMVTGQRPFRGDSNMSTLAAIINKEPAPLPVEVPHGLETLIRLCLRKDPARRFQHIGDVKVALEDLKEESDSGELAAKAAPVRQRRRWLWVVGTPAVILAAALAYWLLSSAGQPAAGALKAVPLTTYPGQEWSPSFSPNGNQVALAWNGEKQDNFDIYILMIGTGARLRLTQDPAIDYSPAWSPDERYVAFLRQLPQGGSGVFLVPAIGGPERKLAEIDASFSVGLPPFSPRLAWSPDGHGLGAPDGSSLVLISTESGEKRALTSPPPQRPDEDPAFSPDGGTLAFTRAAGGFARDLYTLQLSQDLKPVGEPKRLAGDLPRAASPLWTPRGDAIVFSSGPMGNASLWRIPATGAEAPRQIALPGVDVHQPAVPRQGARLAYAQWNWNSDIWRIELERPGGKAARTSRLIASTRLEYDPQFSPDGKRIAFTSLRSGSAEIWMCASDGSNPIQLTFFGGPSGGVPRWSPDGENLVFEQRAAGQSDIYVINSGGGKPRRLTSDSAEDTLPSWSRDGKWIYYASNRSGTQQVWKIPAGGGEPVQVTKQGGNAAFESFDGKFLYYSKTLRGSARLWRLRLADGEETQVVESLHGLRTFAVAENGVYFIPPQKPGAAALLQFLEYSTGAVRAIATIEKQVSAGLAVSPDGRSLLYAQYETLDSDLMLVENFR